MGGNEEYDCRLCEAKSKACASNLDALEKRIALRLEGVENLNDANQRGLTDTITRALDNCNNVLNIHDTALQDIRKDLNKKCVAMDEKLAYNLKDSKIYTNEEFVTPKNDIKDLELSVSSLLEKSKDHTNQSLAQPLKDIKSLLSWRTYVLGGIGLITFLAVVFKDPIIEHFMK